MNRILVITPTYNERENLPKLVREVLRVAPEANLLVVDDGSPDGTGALADRMSEADPRIQVVHRAGKMGLGSAYVEGFSRALKDDYEYVFEIDADLSHDPKDIPRFVEAMEREGADLVIGSRYVPGGRTVNWSFWRRLISRAGGFYARTVLGLPVRDLTGGYKCFRRETLKAIDPGTVASEGYSFQIETTYRTARLGLRIVEIPIVFTERRAGASKMSLAIVLEAMWRVWGFRLGRRPWRKAP